MTTLKDVNDKRKRDGGKDVVDVKRFMMHLSKNTIRCSNWMSHFVYHGDLLKAPDLMEGYQGRDEHFDSDVELLGASSDSSIRSIPLGLSKGGGRGKKDGKKRINRDADTAIPAASLCLVCLMVPIEALVPRSRPRTIQLGYLAVWEDVECLLLLAIVLYLVRSFFL